MNLLSELVNGTLPSHHLLVTIDVSLYGSTNCDGTDYIYLKLYTFLTEDENMLNNFQLPHRRQGPLSRPVWVSTYSIKGSLKLIEKLEKIGAMSMLRLFLGRLLALSICIQYI